MSDEQQAASKLWETMNAWRGSFQPDQASKVCAAALDEFKQAVVAGARREAFDVVVRDAREREAECVSTNREACWAFGVMAKVAERLRDAAPSVPPLAGGGLPSLEETAELLARWLGGYTGHQWTVDGGARQLAAHVLGFVAPPETTLDDDAAWRAYLDFAGSLPLKYQARAGHEARLLVDAVRAAGRRS